MFLTFLSSRFYGGVPIYIYGTNHILIARPFFQPGVEGNKNCIADEHYLPTFFYMLDPTGIANWTVTYVDWPERKWHPRKYMPEDITLELIKNISVSSPHRYDLLKSSLTITMLGSNEITNQYAF
jgi:hypothetical protein